MLFKSDFTTHSEEAGLHDFSSRFLKRLNCVQMDGNMIPF